jgi:hypothetical protein
MSGFASKCFSATAGDANDAEGPKISKSITFSREAMGGDVEENVITLCSACHRRVHIRAESPSLLGAIQTNSTPLGR